MYIYRLLFEKEKRNQPPVMKYLTNRETNMHTDTGKNIITRLFTAGNKHDSKCCFQYKNGFVCFECVLNVSEVVVSAVACVRCVKYLQQFHFNTFLVSITLTRISKCFPRNNYIIVLLEGSGSGR